MEDNDEQVWDYETYLEETYQEEVYGEALFRTMARLCTNPERARRLRTLEQLERETRELLRLALCESGGTGEASAERIAAGERLGAQLSKAPWSEVMRGFRDELSEYVRDLERAQALAPPGKEALLGHVTAHEKALVEFAARELEGKAAGDSLAPVVALLRDPPAARRTRRS